ncbi:MAG: hypothetical protein WA777_13280 [Rhodanobacter sp.]
MDGNDDLKNYFAKKNQTESQAHWQRYKGYLDGPILMFGFVVCLLLWILSLYFLPVVVRSSLLLPSQVALGLFWFVWTMIVAFRTRPSGANAWRRAYRGELISRLKGAPAVVAVAAVICVWCASFGIPGATVAAIPASAFGTDVGSTQLQVTDMSVWRPRNRNTGHKLMITVDGPVYLGKFLWDRYDPALRAFDEERPGAIRCLSIDYRAWLGVAVINAIHACS